MQKRFKTKKRKNINLPKIFFILIIIFISFYLSYNVVYVSYLSKLSNKDIINHIIENTKNKKSYNNIIEEYKNPYLILHNNFNIIEKPSIEVENTNTTWKEELDKYKEVLKNL